MLDDTAVLAISEHGRTPRMQNVRGRRAGPLVAGVLRRCSPAAGSRGAGSSAGRTGSAGDVAETPVSPKDMLATLYHLLGIDPHTEIRDRLGRPVPVGGDGRVRPELLA